MICAIKRRKNHRTLIDDIVRRFRAGRNSVPLAGPFGPRAAGKRG